MKRILGIAAIVLFFLALLILLIVKLFVAPSSPSTTKTAQDPFASIPLPTVKIQNDTPEHTISTCYTWYVEIYSHDNVTIDDIMKRPELADCFTQSFLSTWEARRTSVEADPVLLTQDYQDSWKTSPASTRIIGQSVRSEDVEVTIGAGTAQIQVIAHVIREGNLWKIDSVDPVN